MRIGASFPTTAIGHDSGAIREFVQTAEGLGYDHIRVLDHVMGVDPAYHPEVPLFYYTHESVIREPFTLMGYMAALSLPSPGPDVSSGGDNSRPARII